MQLWLDKKEAGAKAVSDFADLNNHTSPRTYPPKLDEQGLSYEAESEAGRDLLFKRQRARYTAEEIFFNPTAWKENLVEPLKILAQQRYLEREDPLSLARKSARYLIMVQRMYAERLLMLRGICDLDDPETFEEKKEDYNRQGQVMHERYKLGSTIILCTMKLVEPCDEKCLPRFCKTCKKECFQHNTFCKRKEQYKDLASHKKCKFGKWRRLRFGWVDYSEECSLTGYISYQNIYHHLSGLLKSPEHEKAFARVMINLAQGKQSLPELIRREIHNSNLPPECQEKEALNFFRHFFFHCFVMEPGSWLSAAYIKNYPYTNNPGQEYEWKTESSRFKAGLAVSFARVMILLRDGYVRLKQVFSYDNRETLYNPFAIAGMDKNWTQVEERCKRIDEAYERLYKVCDLTKKEQALHDLQVVFGCCIAPVESRRVTVESLESGLSRIPLGKK